MALRQSLMHSSHDCSFIRLKARLVKMKGFVGSFRTLSRSPISSQPWVYGGGGRTLWYIRLLPPCNRQLGNI